MNITNAADCAPLALGAVILCLISVVTYWIFFRSK